jgi:ParB family chromosome partitioning protein
VQRIPIGELHEFKGHPFQVRDDEEMDKTAQSIKEYGITTPLLVRPDPGGAFRA